jgi:hypothetical protein
LTCRESAVEVVECIRSGRTPGAELQAHLMDCRRCRERREDEQRLNTHLQIMRDAVAHQASMARREQLVREFDRAHAGGFQAMWRWALNAAAILLVVLALVHDWRDHGHPAGKVAQPPAESAADISGDESGFVSVPYALPLAKGEFVRVVRTQLDPAALADMGLDIEAADGAEIPADVLLGEDGVPRGVRVLPEAGFLSLE